MDKLTASRINGGNTAYQRNSQDFYPTPPDATQALIDFLKIPRGRTIWEPAVGKGDLANVLRANWYFVIGTDIQTGTDFLTCDVVPCDWIITNPPFSLAEQFIRKCVEFKKPFALLLKSQYWHAKSRLSLFREHPPRYVLPLTWRPDFLFKTRGKGSPLMDVMWVVWDERPAAHTEYFPLERPVIKYSNQEV